MLSFPKNDSTFLLQGPAGRLEVQTLCPESVGPEPLFVAIICHPHPLHQGTMHNKVVTTLSKAFAGLNMATVRFNFRGVGQSEGQHGHSVGEVEDLKCVIEWVRQVLPEASIVLAGFSFGCFIAASCANDTSVSALVTVAPAVSHQSYHLISNIRCPWMVVMGEEDEIIPYSDVSAFVEKCPLSIHYESMPGATHFFHGHLIDIRERVQRWVRSLKLTG